MADGYPECAGEPAHDLGARDALLPQCSDASPPRTLCDPLAFGIDGEGNVRVAHGRRDASGEDGCQPNLTGCGREQVLAANHVIDVRGEIVHDDGELICVDSVAASEDKVARDTWQVLFAVAPELVMKTDDEPRGNAEPQCRGTFHRSSGIGIAACPWVDELLARMGCAGDPYHLRTGAVAWV